MKKHLYILLGAMLCMPMVNAAIKVHTIGDSTMADYDESTTDKRGWCSYLGSFFDASFVTVNNRGKSGADSRQFYLTSNLWPAVKEQMSEGDYLLIQFAHNDEGTGTYGLDNLEYATYCEANGIAFTDKRGTAPQTTFRDYLRLFIKEAREKGVIPVLVAPICRMYFDSKGTITRTGQHDLGDKFYKIVDGVLYTDQSIPADDHTMDYVYAMSVVAEEENVPFINLTAATKEMYEEYGATQCAELLFCEGDKTHTATMGANLIARRAAQLMKDANILADYINIPTSVSAAPASIDLGDIYSGVAVNKEILLTGYGLEPASGSVNISCSENLAISLEKEGPFTTSVQANYEGSTLFQRVYIRAQYAAAGVIEDKITIVSSGTTVEVPISASVLSLEGGAVVQAKWAIDSKTITAETTGLTATCTMLHMMAADIQNDITYGDGEISMVRLHNADDAGAKTVWPANEIDENASRYIDFAVTAPADLEVRLTEISMLLATYSTNTMCYHINIGLGDEMEGVQTIYERQRVTHKIAEDISLNPMITIPAGETFHLRILPWHDSDKEGSGKYICLKDVTISGMAFEPTEMGTQIDEEKILQTKKIIRDGHILIQRGTKTYTLTGVELQ